MFALFFCTIIQEGQGFVTRYSHNTHFMAASPGSSRCPLRVFEPDGPKIHESLHLFQSKPSSGVDGTDRGAFLQALVLLGCLWLFSIPPEFRRVHFCVGSRGDIPCVENRAKCYNCLTFSEWADGVSEYYRNGGGIQFDFTVAEETKQFWKDAVSK